MASFETITPRSLSRLHPLGPEALQPSLIVLWSRDEPGRIGEVVPAPGPGPGPVWILGRGDRAPEPGQAYVGFFRQRPGVLEPTGPLQSPRISRAQLELRSPDQRSLTLRNLGRCALRHNGIEVAEARLEPGDLVELRHELMFLCALRPTLLPALPDPAWLDGHPFGGADRFGLVGESPAMWELRRQLEFVGGLASHVLIRGASGTGKELVARALHAASPRRGKALVSRNAATFPEGLIDAELFGNMRNYPNPGTPERRGLVGEADGSTLFLDEFAELPLSLQAHLLRMLDEGEYQRLGESTPRRSDFRLIAATNRTLEALKHDVLARFTARIELPDLNERREDIPLIVTHLLRGMAAGQPGIERRFFRDVGSRREPCVSPELLQGLVRHRYRTNVRELGTLLLLAMRDSAGGPWLELTPALERQLEEPPLSEPQLEPGSVAAGSREPEVVSVRSSEPGVGARLGFTPQEMLRLEQLRRHGFSARACGEDPDYPGNRQRADLHLRQLICRGLRIHDFDEAATVRALAGGGDVNLEARLEERIASFLGTLRQRLEACRTPETLGALERSLAGEYKGYREDVLALLDVIARFPAR